MSRQIKFRIWDRQFKRFVRNDAGTHCISNWHIDAFSGKPVDFVACNGNGESFYSKDESPDFYVDGLNIVNEPQYVVQQFTGLKDKKGQDIYDGDILLISDAYEEDPENHAFSVRSASGAFWWGGEILVEVAEYAILIGNILENPEITAR